MKKTNYKFSDDIFGGIVNIGFNFEFYGNTYNQVVIASNNYLSFNTGNGIESSHRQSAHYRTQRWSNGAGRGCGQPRSREIDTSG